MARPQAIALLDRAPVVHLATTSPAGAPILRTVHAVRVDDGLFFHGAPAGEKLEALGREAVVSVEEIVAEIPSYFADPERACPATTYYESVQVHAVLDEETDPARKAAALQALMERFQPEGGHVPITHDHPLYRRAVEGILIVRLSLEKLDGKSKLGQNKKPDELVEVLTRLWQRGRPSDPRAIERIRAANPGLPAPPFLAAPAGARLMCALDERHAAEAVALLEDAYWNGGAPAAELAASLEGSSAWVGAVDGDGRLIATARAIADRAKHAWIYDVMVAPAWRARALGQALMRLLLDHPSVRGARKVRLATRDAQSFYELFGFRPFRPDHHELILQR
jgi:nitroimidazol reductase NimA-like FMN-containing flavoprotein (pyridoxamine 5'-phosphate oxidase superfamily)/ribosomal protein S18 acetylase RimI-like enzyme